VNLKDKDVDMDGIMAAAFALKPMPARKPKVKATTKPKAKRSTKARKK
jgi:hypothetical protein